MIVNPVDQILVTTDSTAQRLRDLKSTMDSQTEWQNIQPVITTTFSKLMNILFNIQSHQVKQTHELQFVKKELETKADITDVSSAMSKIISTVDNRKQIENINSKIDLLQSKYLQQFEDLTNQIQKLQSSNQSLQHLVESLKQDNFSSRKITDCNMIGLQLSNKVDKLNQELLIHQESIAGLTLKVQNVSLEVSAVDHKFEDEFELIHQAISRKANANDLVFYRKEQALKVSKDEIERVKEELSDRITSIQASFEQNDGHTTKFFEFTMEQRLAEIKTQLSEKFEDRLRELADKLKLIELRDQSETNQELKQIKFERQQEITMISEIVQTNWQQINNEFQTFKASISDQIVASTSKFQQQLREKVCLQEVKVALKQLADSFREALEEGRQCNNFRFSEVEFKLQQKVEKKFIDALTLRYDSVLEMKRLI